MSFRETAFPLFTAEFGYGLDLHDARFLRVEIAPNAGRPTMRWQLRLFLSPNDADPQHERDYTYEMRFTEYGGELDISAITIWSAPGIRGTPEPSYIYEFNIEGDPTERKQVTMILWPEGKTLRFTCADIYEVRLSRTSE